MEPRSPSCSRPRRLPPSGRWGGPGGAAPARRSPPPLARQALCRGGRGAGPGLAAPGALCAGAAARGRRRCLPAAAEGHGQRVLRLRPPAPCGAPRSSSSCRCCRRSPCSRARRGDGAAARGASPGASGRSRVRSGRRAAGRGLGGWGARGGRGARAPLRVPGLAARGPNAPLGLW